MEEGNEHTICPAPTTPNFFTSNAIGGVVENWRLRDANRCVARGAAGFGEDMRRLDSRASEAMRGSECNNDGQESLETCSFNSDFCISAWDFGAGRSSSSCNDALSLGHQGLAVFIDKAVSTSLDIDHS